MANANNQLSLPYSIGRDLQRQIEHMEYRTRLHQAATEEGVKNHKQASFCATDLNKWNNMILKTADAGGLLDEDFEEFVRANNRVVSTISAATIQVRARLKRVDPGKIITSRPLVA